MVIQSVSKKNGAVQNATLSHSSHSFLFSEIKPMFPDKGLQQQYFPYNTLSERLKGAEKLK